MFKQAARVQRTVVDTLIAPGVIVQGHVVFRGVLCVEGVIRGDVTAEEGQAATLIIAEQGLVEGKISVPTVIIQGALNGNVQASERVELAAQARVQGDIHYQVVQIEVGAQLTGACVYCKSPSQSAEEETRAALERLSQTA